MGYWAGGYWAGGYWADGYWGGIAWRHAEVFRANVVMEISVIKNSTMNQAVQEDVVLNRSVPSTYEELEEV